MVTPTRGLAAFVPTLLQKPEPGIARGLEMLVRASTHYTRVRFLR